MSNWNALGKSLLIGASATVITALNLSSAFGANYAIKRPAAVPTGISHRR